jgi:hypothetical protein
VFGKQKQKTETIQKTKLKAMKTTNNVQKTENRNFEKPANKFFAVVASLILISLTVSANGFWKQLLTNNTYGKMAVLMVDQENENKALLAYATSAKSSVEIKHATPAFNFEPASEKSLEIENWMTNATYFNSQILNESDAVEKSLEIESWMLDVEKFSSDVTAEPALETEAWMMDENFWKN